MYKKHNLLSNKPQNGNLNDNDSAEKMALLMLISEDQSEISNFTKNNIHLLSTETVVKLTARLEQLMAINYLSTDEHNLKMRFDQIEKSEQFDNLPSNNQKVLKNETF
jgi:hypothetical protein